MQEEQPWLRGFAQPSMDEGLRPFDYPVEASPIRQFYELYFKGLRPMGASPDRGFARYIQARVCMSLGFA